MNISKFNSIVKKYKKCPSCGASWKGTDLSVELKNEVVHVRCICGFSKYINEYNNEVNVMKET